MKFTLAAVSLFAAASYAAPTEGAVSQAAAAPQWTMVNLKRPCNAANTACTWSFTINENNGSKATPCTFTVKGNPASQTNSANNKCGVYTVGTGWSGQFGPGKGFTTLSVVNNVEKMIVYPSYTDVQLQSGKVVKPNQSYPPANLP